MRLIGMPDSPYVRRVAISLKLLGLAFDHEAVSVFRHYDRFRTINPMVKAPTLIADDGTVLVDSSLILDYAEHLVDPARRLLPTVLPDRLRALQVIGAALVACEKTVQLVYENMRPEDKRLASWTTRVDEQLCAAWDRLEAHAAAAPQWLLGGPLTQADVTLAVAWRFTQFALPGRVDPGRYPAIAAHSARAEALPEFVSTPLE